jgi:hypothetical protein
MAWEIAMLSRQRTVPSLKSLLSAKSAKPLTGKELEKKRSDFQAMASQSNIDLINRVRSKSKK